MNNTSRNVHKETVLLLKIMVLKIALIGTKQALHVEFQRGIYRNKLHAFHGKMLQIKLYVWGEANHGAWQSLRHKRQSAFVVIGFLPNVVGHIYMCVYVYTYTYIYIYMHMCVNTHVDVYIYTVYIYTHTIIYITIHVQSYL